MPSLTFVLPHWLYWAGLIVFPVFAMVMARRTKARARVHGDWRGYSLPLAYMILIAGGMLGLHRFYLKSLLGLLFIPVFIFILVANGEQREYRASYSDAAALVESAQGAITREGPRIAEMEGQLPDLREKLAQAPEGSIGFRLAERGVKRAEGRIASSKERLARAKTDLETARPAAETAAAGRAFWRDMAAYAFYLLVAMMALDAVLMPWLKRRAEAKVAADDAERRAESEADEILHAVEDVEQGGDQKHLTTGWTGVIDRMSFYAGELVSYWAVIAVFAYYYEVIARYVFNSPTIWVHEAMYLMFGMQYLICGAYAMLTESHVRVDVFYAPLSPRRKAIVDLATSVFFYIFAGTLLFTSLIFAWDATVVDEVSFNEWRIAYWPMKWAMVIGGLLLVLQGISKLAQDVRAVANPAGGA
ncbi:TRAP-type mannitol/chloroaromatic compound transport system permease small subunit [Breoghania corrubedonensis]|uniref:TRAP transporter small permease protein n=1 Tax=Breoghania corrubedonensis TaxID=665038 RepID=A0A2T5VF41_9HYPH|nr:TRAP transporter small permease subunit [Breoghania corrubedonensis]PTW62374.1 TRAP-type mannitol/chloroaromatic compound transport system permease small subunit [Breoghania corrubedonensis]